MDEYKVFICTCRVLMCQYYVTSDTVMILQCLAVWSVRLETFEGRLVIIYCLLIYAQGLKKNLWSWNKCSKPVVRKQGNSGGKVNNFGGDRIGHFEKKSLYEYVSNSELLARWSCLNLQTKNSTFNSKIDRKITHYDPTSPTEDNTGHLK